MKKAVDLLEHVVPARERTLSEEHPDRLASQYALARAYRVNGQVKEAVDLLEHVVAVRERTLSKEPGMVLMLTSLYLCWLVSIMDFKYPAQSISTLS